MLEIRPLSELNEAILRQIITGYVSYEKYRVSLASCEQRTTFNLELVSLAEPYVKHFDHSEEDIHHFQEAVRVGWSIGTFDGEEPAAVAIAEPEGWNDTLRVWEFHVAESYRGRGIGRHLMNRLVERARPAGMRAMVIETQNTNQDFPDGEMAVFMKRRLSWNS